MTVSVRASDLRQCLKMLKRNWADAPGDAEWRCWDGVLEIRWAGEIERIRTMNPSESWRVCVPGTAMRNLVQTMPAEGTLTIGINMETNRLVLGMFTLPCEIVHAPMQTVVPGNASPLELLRLKRKYGQGILQRAGQTIERDLAAAEARLAQSLHTATQALGWLGISEVQLKAAIDEQLQENTHVDLEKAS